MAPRPQEPLVYQMKLTLMGVDPPVWRRVLVSGDATLEYLHAVIQLTMGWEGGHLHQFIVGEKYYDTADDETQSGDESKVRLDEVAPKEKDEFTYEYDFGDDWIHRVIVEKTLPPGAVTDLPVCVAGARACPPEDCGGPFGYAGLVEALRDPGHPDHEQMLEWVGGELDAERFDLDEVNTALARLTRPRGSAGAKNARSR